MKETQYGKYLSSSAVAGFAAGGITRMGTAPLDVLKIRLQLQQLRNPLYSSASQALFAITRSEGVRSLWKGNLCATYLWVSYGAVQFGLYDGMKARLKLQTQSLRSHDKKAATTNITLTDKLWQLAAINTSLATFCMGSLSAMAATAASYPFDLMRTQFAVQGRVAVHRSLVGFAMHTWAAKGLRGFYAGLLVAVGGIAPASGLNFAVYEIALPRLQGWIDRAEVLRIRSESGDKPPRNSFLGLLQSTREGLCGALAGGFSKLALFPLDSLKRRMQMQSVSCSFTASGGATGGGVGAASAAAAGASGGGGTAGVVPQFRGLAACVRWTWIHEGVRGFYKGLWPSLAKSMLSTGLMFWSYQAVKDALDRSGHFG